MSSPRNRQFGAGNGALRKDLAPEPEQFRRTPAGIWGGFPRFLDEFLLFDQAAEVLLVDEPPGQRLDTALQLQERKCFRHQFEHHRTIFNFGPQPGYAGGENAAVIEDHRLARARQRVGCGTLTKGPRRPSAYRLRDEPRLVEQFVALQDELLVPGAAAEAEGDRDALAAVLP